MTKSSSIMSRKRIRTSYRIINISSRKIMRNRKGRKRGIQINQSFGWYWRVGCYRYYTYDINYGYFGGGCGYVYVFGKKRTSMGEGIINSRGGRYNPIPKQEPWQDIKIGMMVRWGEYRGGSKLKKEKTSGGGGGGRGRGQLESSRSTRAGIDNNLKILFQNKLR